MIFDLGASSRVLVRFVRSATAVNISRIKSVCSACTEFNGLPTVDASTGSAAPVAPEGLIELPKGFVVLYDQNGGDFPRNLALIGGKSERVRNQTNKNRVQEQYSRCAGAMF
jgi:hypothetical protein